MKAFFILFIMTMPLLASTEPVKEEIKELKKEVSHSADLRELHHHTGMLGYEFISSWLPFKFVGSYTYNLNRKWSFELEMARGRFGTGLIGVDLASVTEYRYSLLARRFTGNSFHFLFGFYKDDFRATLGSDILDDMSDTSVKDLRVEVMGATVGIGNRWQWQSGFTLDIDWFRMNMPVFGQDVDDEALKNVVDDNDYEMIQDGLHKVAHVPTFVLCGIYLGYSF